MPVNVLYLITDLHIGGTEKMLYETVTNINITEYHPIVCGLKSWGVYAQKLKEKGVRVITLNSGNNILSLVKAIFKLRNLMKKEKICILQTYLTRANVIGRISARLASVPIVISSIRVMEQEKKYHLFLERMTSSLCNKNIVNSQALRDFAIQKMNLKPKNIEVIYNGINTEELPTVDRKAKRNELGIGEKDFLIGTVGRLHKQKGIEYLLEAIKLITKSQISNSQFQIFLIVGNGPERRNLELRIENLELKGKVHLLGWRTDALEIISILDIFVLPSLWEGTPNVVLEAMAYGVPVIATNVGGVAELITDKETGVLVPPRNSEHLAKAILWVTRNYKQAKLMGEKAKKIVNEKFPIEKMVRETEKIYTDLTFKLRKVV